MASSAGCPGRNAVLSHSNQSSSSPKTLRFFKIIFNPEAQRLKIPTDFTRRNGHRLPDRVFLKAPGGPAFEVELVNSNGEIRLQKGWDEFKKYYSVDFGHLLLFKYDKGSNFHVLIFDMTASEIEYPFDANNDRRINLSREPYKALKIQANRSVSDDDSVEILKEPLNDNQTEDDDSGEFLGNRGRKRTRGRSAVDKEASMAYQGAKAFKNDNPSQKPYFIALMQPSYVSVLYALAIPVSIVRENLPGKDNDIELRVSNGKVWPVKCCIRAPNARIYYGWKAFVEGNGLKVGDACVFEVSKSNKFVWKVTIFRS